MRVLFALLFMVLASSAMAQEDAPAILEDEPVAPIGEQESSPAGEQDAAPEQDNAAQLLPAIQGIEAAIRGLIAEEDAIEREAERRRNDADLRAQERMAFWALWMTLATGASVFLTGVGVLLIWRTLLHTRDAATYAGQAVEQAKLATKAAQDAVVATQVIGEAQTRAYLTCSGGDYTVDRLWEQAWLTIVNKGQSPAFDVTVSAAWSVMIPDAESKSGLSRHDGKPAEGKTEIVSAGGTAKMLLLWSHAVTGTVAHDYVRGMRSSSFNIDGVLSWTDVFGQRQSISFSATEKGPDGPVDLGEKFDRRGSLTAFNRGDVMHRAAD